MAILKPGYLLFAPDGMGFGKFLSIEGPNARVSFFHSAAHSQTRKYPLRSLRRGILSKQTRIFVKYSGRWMVGRIIEYQKGTDESFDYIAKFPDKRMFEINETELNVRCYQPLSNPADVLACWAVETQYFHERRRRLLEEIIEQCSAAEGMTGLLSSSIELVRHQVEVARRVLQDPVQRYLLADEVGMGKTIEAGIIIRQCLIDNPKSAVLVVTPTHLVQQWRSELTNRFRVEDFPGNVEILPFNDIDADTSVPDLLVIDEVHNVFDAKGATSGSLSHLERMALATPRLLLLSATPVLGHEETMLKMLNLLNPDVYALGDLESFRTRISKSREYGTLLLGIRDDALPFVLQTRGQEAIRLFENDDLVQKLATELMRAAKDKDRDAISSVCAPLRRHIAETYRVHQRLIRTRRVDTDGWEFITRGPAQGKALACPELFHVCTHYDEDERLPYIFDLIEQWRQIALQQLEGNPGESLKRALVSRYIEFFDAVSEGLDQFEAVVGKVLKSSRKGSLFDREMEILRACSEELQQEAGGKTRYDSLPQVLREARRRLQARNTNAPVKIVVFTTSTASARKLHQKLSNSIGKAQVLLLEKLSVDNEEECESESFFNDDEAWVLICDRRGEEGLNFHFAQMAVHFDLPFSPGRLEQRIGRLDRFGRKFSPIEHIVVLPIQKSGDNPWKSWCQFLAHSFRIFNQPISDLQFQLDNMTEELSLTLFSFGPVGLTNSEEQFRAQLIEQRERLDEQYALDRIALEQDLGADLFNKLEAVEEDEGEWGKVLNNFLVDGMQFTRKNRPSNVFELGWSDSTLIPERPWKIDFIEAMGTGLTTSRKTAAKNKAVSLVRPGSPIVTSVEKLLSWDDRGTAFATWRAHPEWPAERGCWTGFRLFQIVEPDLDFNSDFGSNEIPQSLKRRAHSLLPPWTVNIYIDTGLNEVTDPALLKILELPYKGAGSEGRYRDFSLGKYIQVCNSLADPAIFRDWCVGASAKAKGLLLGSTAFRERMTGIISNAQKVVEIWNERLSRRKNVELQAGREEAAQEILREMQLNLILLEGVKNPSVRLDAMGFFVIADQGPGVTVD